MIFLINKWDNVKCSIKHLEVYICGFELFPSNIIQLFALNLLLSCPNSTILNVRELKIHKIHIKNKMKIKKKEEEGRRRSKKKK